MGGDAQTDKLPACYFMLQIKKFSDVENKVNKYESAAFEAEGCNWKLVLYPKGNERKDVKQHLSVYLALTDNVKADEVVYAVFRLYLLDQINHNDFILPDTKGEEKERCFHKSMPEWGFDRFIDNDRFKDTRNGYLVDDTCTLGAEIVRVRKETITGKGEFFLTPKESPVSKHKWKIENFSKKKDSFIKSKIFGAGVQEWEIELYPRGTDYGNTTHLSLYLSLADHIAIKGRIYADVTLRILDQLRDRHFSARDKFWFDETATRHGWSRFISLKNFNSSKNSLLVKDVCFVEAEVKVVGFAVGL